MPMRLPGWSGTLLVWSVLPVGVPSLLATEVALRQPAVRSVFPLGGKAGRMVKVAIEGEFLDRASLVRCECEDVTGSVRKAGALGLEVEMNISEPAEPGLRVMYVESPRGTSNRFFFRVTRWESVSEVEPNNQLEEAQAVKLPVVVEGRIARLTDVDFFRFHVEAAERLAFNVLAARTKAPGFVSIALLDPKGRELARKHSGVGADPYLEYRFKESGDYFLAVYPRRFADFFTVVKDDQLINWQYQLAIGRSPMLWSVFPAGASRGTSVDVQVHVDFLDAGAKPSFSGKGVSGEPLESIADGRFRMKVHIAPDAEPGIHLLRFPDSSGNLGALGFAVSDGPEILATEKQPQVVAPPVIINGRILKPDEHDAYRFKVNSEDRMTFHVDAKSLGSQMTDPQLALVRAEGDFVDWADERCKTCAGFYDTVLRKEMLDPVLTHAFISRSANDADAAGDYNLVIMDNSSHGSEDLTYRLDIRPQRPGFRAGSMTDHVNAASDGMASIPVAIAREEGFKGDVEITVDKLPAGWTAKPLKIAGGEDAGKLEVEGKGSGLLRLVARAHVGEKEVAHDVLVPPVSTEDGAGYLEPVRESIQIAFVERPALSLSVEPPPSGFVLDQAKGAGIELPCKIAWCAGCKASSNAVTFEAEELPAGMRITKQQMSSNGELATVTLAGDPQVLRPGSYRIALRGRAQVNGREVSETTSAIGFRVK